ncbi:ABC transporter ATP-binding protein [Rothia sp. AR01]|uniref:ABC transporter ATP-binding protein n=1 Tax=Rothia santali TaxID=2949643 RepID=A0A9X2KGZ8_9MICC|nr:ABC transporter ATP-binding protein [Rothia santali]MCP3425362.1 ABC transporter ATP-binding protein [Rothia santali]
MIRADGVGYSYGGRPALREATLETSPGRVLGLIGPNGSGKTTLLRLLHGGLAPASGTVTVDGADLAALAPRELARSVAVVVQEGEGPSGLSVAEMVLLGRSPHLGALQREGREDRRIAEESLRRVGALGLAARPFAGLSGGERQRVLIARALAQRTEHLLLDEPTNHLDVRFQHEVLGLVRGLGATVVVVLHDLNLAARYCDDVVLLDAGRVVARGTPAEVLVPERLEGVYRIGVRRVELDGQLHLLFSPRGG